MFISPFVLNTYGSGEFERTASSSKQVSKVRIISVSEINKVQEDGKQQKTTAQSKTEKRYSCFSHKSNKQVFSQGDSRTHNISITWELSETQLFTAPSLGL